MKSIRTLVLVAIGVFAVLLCIGCISFSRNSEPIVKINKRVVILGGGYSAGTVASILQQRFEVVLIDKKPYFENIIANPRVAAEEGLGSANRIDHEKYLKRTQVIVDEVVSINTSSITTRSEKTIDFDYLVIATGSRSSEPFEIEKGAKVVDIRDSVACERVLNEKLGREAQTVVVIGGGPAGVEVTAELGETFPQKHIHIIASQATLLPNMHTSAGQLTQKTLDKMGNVTIHRGQRVNRVTKNGDIYTIGNAPLLKADVIFLAIGSKPNSEFVRNSLPEAVDAQGYVRVNEKLQMKGHHKETGLLNCLSWWLLSIGNSPFFKNRVKPIKFFRK